MDWNAIGAVGEILGAAGVIGSLVYLGIQIGQSTRTERARAFQDVFAAFTSQNHEMFGTRNIDLIVTGMRDFKSLSGGDRLRFDHLMLGYFNAIEATMFSKNAYLMGQETLENWSYAMRTRFLPYSGVRDWWSEAKGMMAPDTVTWVDEQLQATDTESDYWGIK